MYRPHRSLLTVALAGLAALPTLCGAADPVPSRSQPGTADRGKALIEMPIKNVVRAADPVPPARAIPANLDVGKYVIEMPVKNVVRAADAVPTARDVGKGRVELPLKNVVARDTAAAGDKFVNPKVEPGKVKWHNNLDTACAASRKSGKPVLVFHLMGKLDDQFC
jgi:hypothetical protein